MGAPAIKKSVTIPADLVDQVNGLLPEDDNFSGYVTEALRLKVELDRLAELVRELEDVNGPADPRAVEHWKDVFAR